MGTPAFALSTGAPAPHQLSAGGKVQIEGEISANAALLAVLSPPGSHTAITPSDATDVTAIASLGLQCTVAGNVSYRGTTTSSTTVTQAVVAGQYVWGSFSRVMAATTATMVGLAP